MTKRHVTLPAASVLILIASGCQKHENLRLEIGQTQRPAALEATPPAMGSDQPLVERTEPSITDLSRENWDTITYVVPVDGVAHNADWRWLEPQVGTSHRATGTNPTPETALELEDHAPGDQALIALITPVYAAIEFVTMPVRAFLEPLWDPYYSPSDPFQRTQYAEPVAFPQPTDGGPVGEVTPRASAILADVDPDAPEADDE
ncbi:MAG: hypothetical protein AAGB51_06555 [Planctomycetota bacterium]